MLDAALWGLVQGLTEFLPISSSGHLVLVPEFFDQEPPGLATTAVLHLGTLAAVVWYFRQDVAWLARPGRDPQAKHILKLLAVGTVPAVIAGLALESTLDDVFESAFRVGFALIGTGLILLASSWLVRRIKTLDDATLNDALLVGGAQAVALIPGISRSGITITAALGRHFSDFEAARFSFLLSIPVILGGGAKQLFDLAGEGGLEWEMAVGVLVAAISGYVAIAVLIRVLTSWGLRPFAFYCFVVGAFAVVAL